MPDLFLELRDTDEGDGTTPAPLDEALALALLLEAEFTAAKLIPWGSNYSFAVALDDGQGREQLAIYKPRSGESPLWDFPEGTLFLREVASYHLSRRLGWNIVPPTVVRDGPHGIGSVQLYVQPRENTDEWNPHEFWGACHLAIERLVLFDHIANNADRKLSHCLLAADGTVWGIDHGLTFNIEPKLRTALWQFSGEPVDLELLNDLQALLDHRAEVTELLAPTLDGFEIEAFFRRVERMIAIGRYPTLNPRRNIPYGWW